MKRVDWSEPPVVWQGGPFRKGMSTRWFPSPRKLMRWADLYQVGQLEEVWTWQNPLRDDHLRYYLHLRVKGEQHPICGNRMRRPQTGMAVPSQGVCKVCADIMRKVFKLLEARGVWTPAD